MYPRYCKSKVTDALIDTPVVIIAGPRQCGKTTLAKEFIEEDWQYLTFDDMTQLSAARDDPVGFIRHMSSKHTVLDEVQRVPEIFLAIKQAVDEDRRPGKFLLTGSANALLLPQVADSLAGRVEEVPLLPLAECEIQRKPSTFIAKLLAGEAPATDQTRIRDQLIEKIITGGFPEPLSRDKHIRRTAWQIQYMNSIVQKDMKDLGQIEHLEVMPKLIKLLCHQVGRLSNYTELAGHIGLSRQTMARYIQLLERLFMFEKLAAWHKNDNKRIVKTPKIHIVDTGLLCALTQINQKKLEENSDLMGGLVESYVYCELKRLVSWQDEPLYFYHYRDKDKVEVDIVIETISGQVIGVEVKSGSSLKKQDFQGLERLKNIAGKDFQMGIILYDGDHTTSHSKDIFSVPIGALWE